MKQYIDKSAVIAEIERRKLNHIDLTEFNSGYKNAIFDILSILDDLEVKEVDLEKEIQDYIYTLPYSKTGIPNGWKHSWERKDVEKIAKHFFELGIKTQKGSEE